MRSQRGVGPRALSHRRRAPQCGFIPLLVKYGIEPGVGGENFHGDTCQLTGPLVFALQGGGPAIVSGELKDVGASGSLPPEQGAKGPAHPQLDRLVPTGSNDSTRTNRRPADGAPGSLHGSPIVAGLCWSGISFTSARTIFRRARQRNQTVFPRRRCRESLEDPRVAVQLSVLLHPLKAPVAP